LEALRADQVVVAHIADAPDRPMAEQVAFERKMLGEGTADLKGFVAALRRIGYDGPLVCEPFQESFKTMDSAMVADRVSRSLDAVLAS
jgi:sugar phosphate isomerase/epimerase